VATYVAVPTDGIVFQGSFRDIDRARLQDTRLLVTSWRFPGGTGWQSLPSWLPQDRAVWSGTAAWAIPAATPAIEPVPSLR
jgi:hypothetical protein